MGIILLGFFWCVRKSSQSECSIVFELRAWKDNQTDRQTDQNALDSHSPLGGAVSLKKNKKNIFYLTLKQTLYEYMSPW